MHNLVITCIIFVMRDILIDIGIGSGGEYLNRDNGAVRVGFDVRQVDLDVCQKRYGRDSLHLVKHDVLEDGIPVPDGSAMSVDIFFPYLLFLGLVNTDGIWGELGRVLRVGGNVDIFYSTIDNRKRVFVAKDEPVYISSPFRRIQAAGMVHGFTFAHADFHPRKIDELIGTSFSDKVVKERRKFRESLKISGVAVTKEG